MCTCTSDTSYKWVTSSISIWIFKKGRKYTPCKPGFLSLFFFSRMHVIDHDGDPLWHTCNDSYSYLGSSVVGPAHPVPRGKCKSSSTSGCLFQMHYNVCVENLNQSMGGWEREVDDASPFSNYYNPTFSFFDFSFVLIRTHRPTLDLFFVRLCCWLPLPGFLERYDRVRRFFSVSFGRRRKLTCEDVWSIRELPSTGSFNNNTQFQSLNNQ